ncbi:MAG: helix-turn-helix transcriptional regulator [Microcoleus sp. PH2017_22_RUC_O_B]|uniref:helix-turn-helix domain-containing protein n=1 Tax=unclassified Microcoleus TaxID=2642155 RepID=UPI001D1A9152|nr:MULTISPECIES: helix-turn-helix transcriptional regulator [unclassified Microcoleus]MCC3528392.1 helix-turn-helix transcriptional regulator [Microcoleus sp. PH2017_21_RUC_O_A]MCC3540568.1 helix-turn-helix transcriptional regulator [Microcoleus sp. PH2017_22_RUC_O_B]
MIKDEFQYEVSQEWVAKFKKTIAAMERDEEAKRKDFLKWDAGRGAVQCHVDKLEAEIAEYERLMNCDTSQSLEITVEDITELPFALIKARMAAKITQEELAEIIGIDPERIKQCEDKNYQCASFVEIIEVSAALGVEFKTAVVEVDFGEVEIGKKIAEKRRKKRMKMASKAS